MSCCLWLILWGSNAAHEADRERSWEICVEALCHALLFWHGVQECQTTHWASHKEVCRHTEPPPKTRKKAKLKVQVKVTGRKCSSCGRQEEAAGPVFKCCGRCRTALYCSTVSEWEGVCIRAAV